jgi:hypothetical protein
MIAAAVLTAATAFAQNATPTAPARETPRPEDPEPRVNTSSPAQSPDDASSRPAAGAAESRAVTPSSRRTASGGNAQREARASSAAGANPASDAGKAAGANAAAGASTSAGANAAAGQAGAAKPAARGKGPDRLELDTTQITGNRELPKVLYIVPWKRSDLGDLVGRPVNSLLDEVLTPVDRDVFQRENRYYRALTPGAAENDALSAPDAREPTPLRAPPTPTNGAPAAGSQGSATRATNGSGSTNGSSGSGNAAPPPRDER